MRDNRRRLFAPPALPPGAQQPAMPPYAFPVPHYDNQEQKSNDIDLQTQSALPWGVWNTPTTSNQLKPPARPSTGRLRVSSMQPRSQPRPRSAGDEPGDFGPQPNVHRSTSHTIAGRPHHYSRSDVTSPHLDPNFSHAQRNLSQTSFSSYNSNDYEGYSDDTSNLVKGLSDMSLQSKEGLKRFQAGELAEVDQAWHRLLPNEAREALGKQEVQRQSVIFEVVKSEREYVSDLQAVQDVFIEGLRKAHPPIIPEPALSAFIKETFGNLDQILVHHKRILSALFTRQQDQHPLIQSIADIILDTTLKSEFRSAYETYIKHYPLAESHHRNQLKRNRAYEIFLQSVTYDSRIRKRDLITFLSRPVTRLPRLNLLLEQTLKLTDTKYDHPDSDTLQIILGILKDLIKSTQPGIEAAESKVKFWELCESLVFQKGEIIDLDLYDESRSLIFIGPVIRRTKSDAGFTEKWTNLVAALLDNYFILVREETRPNGAVRRMLVTRPIPLSFLRLGSFEDQPEIRKGKTEDGGLFDSFRTPIISIYPFTIYHAASRMNRRYTLYVTNDATRKKWHTAFVNTIGVHQVRQDANLWFSPQVITDGFFRVPKNLSQETSSNATGRINCAVPFVTTNSLRRFIVVGCGNGVYVGPVHSEQYHCALTHKNVVSLSAFTTLDSKIFNRLVLHVDSTLLSYSLDILSRISLGQAQQEALNASVEKLIDDAHIVFAKHLHIGRRALVIYASKRRLGTTMTLQVLEAVNSLEYAIQPLRNHAQSFRNFRPYGEPGYVPKDAYDIIGLAKNVAICTSGGIVTADPSNLAQSAVRVVPELQDTANNRQMATLKSLLEGVKPLGLIRLETGEFLVIYDELGCYIDKHGIPTRQCGYIKWETKATSYASRNGHILLFSPEFIEVRNSTTGRIVQVIEGQDVRLLYSGPYTKKENPVLVAMRGKKDDDNGQSEKIVELLETEEISLISPAVSSVWDEWDIQ